MNSKSSSRLRGVEIDLGDASIDPVGLFSSPESRGARYFWSAPGEDGFTVAASGTVADYFVDRSEGSPRWDGRTVHGVRFELLDMCIIEGLGLTEQQPWTVVLYRLVGSETSVKSSAGG